MWINGCISVHTRSVYILGMVRIRMFRHYGLRVGTCWYISDRPHEPFVRYSERPEISSIVFVRAPHRDRVDQVRVDVRDVLRE